MMYSIMASCRMIDVNVRDYLLWVLPQLAAQDPNHRSAASLLPHDYAELLKAGKIEQPFDGRFQFIRVTRKTLQGRPPPRARVSPSREARGDTRQSRLNTLPPDAAVHMAASG
jgi:hypothetical protein